MNKLTVEQNIEHKIFTIRGVQVMIDRDLAELYGVETRALKQAVKRNIERFPSDFMFELDETEIQAMVSQSVIPSKKHLGGAKPYVFTEQGVASLSSVLNSQTAIDINISILRAFVKMRKFLMDNADVFKRLELVEKRQISHEIKTDEKFEILFNAIESKSITPKQGVFFDGQIFDAYALVSELVKKTTQSLILIGASLKDLGKKWFAFSLLEVESFGLMERVRKAVGDE